MRLEGKERHDLKHDIREKELAIGSIVLLYDTRYKKDMSHKLSFKWLGPYQICDADKDKGTDILEELDRLQLADAFAGDRLKKFHLRQQLQLDHALNLDNKEIPTLSNFLVGNSNSELSEAPDDF